MKENGIPEVRFPGFEDFWEQRKFKDTVKIERGGSPRPIDQFITDNKDGLNWIKISDAPQSGSYITSCAEKIKPEGLSKTREVVPGDLILSNSMSFGRPYIMAINGCIHDGWLLIRNELGIYDLNFLCILLGTEQMLNQYKSLAAGSAVNNLNKELVGGTTVRYPSLKEQYAIGRFFEKVEQVTTLHQRKIDNLKKLKNGLLQKMFPQKGEKVPQVRFPGFTGDWEQRKVGELTEELHDYEPLKSGLPLLTSSRQGLMFQNEYRGRSSTDNEDTLFSVVPRDACTYRHMSDDDVFYLNINRLVDKGLVSREYPVFTTNEDANLDFVVQYINSNPAFSKFCREQKLGGTRTRLYYSRLSEFKIPTPTIEEQNKISEFLSDFDQTITLHQRKLDDFKKLKRGLLQKMFV